MSGYERRNRKVFRSCWKVCSVDALATLSGSEFQMCVCVCVCLFVCGSALLQPERSVCVASERFLISTDMTVVPKVQNDDLVPWPVGPKTNRLRQTTEDYYSTVPRTLVISFMGLRFIMLTYTHIRCDKVIAIPRRRTASSSARTVFTARSFLLVGKI